MGRCHGPWMLGVYCCYCIPVIDITNPAQGYLVIPRDLTCRCHRRVLLFAKALGVPSWGVESDELKLSKARTACSRALRTYGEKHGGLTHAMQEVQATYINVPVEEVTALPEGATAIFSFWQGVSMAALEHVGMLASACPTFKALCLVERGSGIDPDSVASWVHEELRFPPLKLHTHFGVAAGGGSKSKYTAYVLLKV